MPTKRILSVPAIRILLACCATLATATGATAQCRTPHYREGMVWEDSESTVLMAVSIPLREFAPARLACLAGALKHRYPGRESITVLIFSSLDAARNYHIGQPDMAPPKTEKQARLMRLRSSEFQESQLHGVYSYDARKHEEYVDLGPFGHAGESHGSYDTRINLPATEIPPCRMEIDNRCVLALDQIHYPPDALTSRLSGALTLAGTIARSGKITNVSVVGPNGEPVAQEGVLANEAIQNLKSWTFEPGPRQDAIRITYSFVIDPSLPIPPSYRNNEDVRFALPDQVVIRGNTLK